ncbi:unnamed protein product [Mycena citricolor]|uniref:Uncharacterized protein n=1 Tax=Mycena citricolor TaxID=2018698 RepID=A0AAD2HT52_9AGAR|nr:unnamed protein product [Mycena citricolor]
MDPVDPGRGRSLGEPQSCIPSQIEVYKLGLVLYSACSISATKRAHVVSSIP